MRQMVQFKWDSEECEEMLKHSREETLERGCVRPKIRGRSETRHYLFQGVSRVLPDKRLHCPGTIPGFSEEGEDAGTPDFTTNTYIIPCSKEYKLKSDRFVPVAKQQDAHVTKGWWPNRQPLYHSMLSNSKPEEFIMFIMHSMTLFHNYYEAEFDDLMIFGRERSSISRQVIASIIYTKMPSFKGHPYMFPIILCQMEDRQLHREGTPLPNWPKESRSRCTGGHINLINW